MTEKDNHNEEEELRADEMADQQTGDNVADNASAEDGEGEPPSCVCNRSLCVISHLMA